MLTRRRARSRQRFVSIRNQLRSYRLIRERSRVSVLDEIGTSNGLERAGGPVGDPGEYPATVNEFTRNRIRMRRTVVSS